MRVLVESVVGLLLTLAVALLALAGFMAFQGSGANSIVEAATMLFGFHWPAVVVLAVLVPVGNRVFRRRGSGARVASHLVSTVIANIVSLVIYTVIGLTAGGWAALLIAFAIAAGVALFIGAAVGMSVTHLVIYRRGAQPAAQPSSHEPLPPAPAAS